MEKIEPPTAQKPIRIVMIFAAIIVVFALIYIVANLKKHSVPSNAAETPILSVDTTKVVRPFTKRILGQAMVNWEHSWGKGFPSKIPGLTQAFKEAHVGVIRYAGGNWTNSVGWDRSNQRTPYSSWTKNGNTYYFHYGADEINDVMSFANEVGSDVMIEVNVMANDPAMWADMVKYINTEGRKDSAGRAYYAKYWELGNEDDADPSNWPNPQIPVDTYAARVKTYTAALLAADPSIKIVSPAIAETMRETANNTSLNDWLSKSVAAGQSAGHPLDMITYHWYQQSNTSDINAVMLYRFYQSGTTPIDSRLFSNRYSRFWADVIPGRIRNEVLSGTPNTTIGVTELNIDATNNANPLNGNHIGAVWFADVLGRLAYNGVDTITAYTGYGTETYSALYPDNGDHPTKILARPRYYADIMYARYFGDTIVQSTSYKNDDISIWASIDSRDGNKLKIMVTNLTNTTITVPINVAGYTGSSASVYQMKSTNPTDISANSATANAPTTINGFKIDAMNVAGSLAQIQPQTLAVNGSTINYSYVPYSVTAFVVSGSTGGSTPIPSPTPTVANPPTATPTTRPTSTPVPVNSPTPTVRPTNTPTPTVGPSPTPKPTITPIISPTARPTNAPTAVPSPTSSARSTITIFAMGTPGNSTYPTMKLQINGSSVKTWTVNGSLNSYTYAASTRVTANQVRVRFSNDYYSSSKGDRNLRVDRIVIDGVTYESEAPTVYSTGTWNQATGCAAGFKESDWLQCNGYFQYK